MIVSVRMCVFVFTCMSDGDSVCVSVSINYSDNTGIKNYATLHYTPLSYTLLHNSTLYSTASIPEQAVLRTP
jgi:hypothetical protein